jgi:hypothetical protein
MPSPDKRMELNRLIMFGFKHFYSEKLYPSNDRRFNPDNSDCDIICIEGHYKKSDGGCFWVAESIESYYNRNNHQIIGTIAIRNLKQFESTAELKRMYGSRQFRQLGLRHKMLDTAIDFAKGFG